MSDAPRIESAAELRRIESIVQAALDTPEDERESLLRALCGDDSVLRSAVQRLLDVPDTIIDSFMADTPALAAISDIAPAGASIAGVPRQLGRYEILRKLGEGGMGVVYEARQDNPRRVVALKVIRPVLGSAGLLKRFRTETSALGQLQHPGIARIYDAGTHLSDDGSSMPYFAMELVSGPPLDQYVREHKLPLRNTLALFAQVCDAVQYAHAHGVIHRDLKPGNILVQLEDAQGGGAEVNEVQPKIIDFGVARLIESDIAATRQTDAGQVIGTLAYMSPEQVGGETGLIDARTDVYSLGIVLYEIVAGRAAFDMRDRSLAEALRLIREEEATRLSAIDVRLRGDIETIVSKSIEKARERRYASAAELAADIRRYLGDQPIQARPVSTLYQLRKFARRNRGLVAGMLATGLVLILGTIVSGSLAFSESRQRKLAVDRAEEAATHAKIASAREKEARELAYRSSLAAANAAIQGGSVALSRESVAAAPQELRGWEWRYLNYVVERSERVLGGHAGGVAFSVDRSGRRLASIDSAGVVRLWDAERAEVRHIWQGARAKEGPAIDPAGRVVLWSGEGYSTLASADSGEIIWRGQSALQVSPLAFSPTGDTFVACQRFGRHVMMFDTMSGKPIITLDLGKELYYAHFSPDGRWIAARSNQGHVALINAADQSVRWCGPGWNARFSHDGEQLALWSARNTHEFALDLVSTSDCSSLGTRVFRGAHPQSLWDIHGSGGRVVSCDPAGRMLLFDAAHDAIGPRVTLLAHSGGQDVRFSADGRAVFSAGSDGEVRIWSADNCPSPLRIESAERDWAYAGGVSKDGRLICRVGWGCATVLDTESATTLWRRYYSRSFFHAASFNVDATLVAIAGQQGEIHILDAMSGDRLKSLRVPDASLIFSLAWLPDGERLLASLDNGAICIVDSGGGGIRVVGKHESPATRIAIAPDGRMVASGSGSGMPGRDFGEFAFGDDTSVRLWDLESVNQVALTRAHVGAVTAIAFSPEGQQLASGSRDGLVLICRPPGLDGLISINCGGAIESLAFSADGTRLAVAAAGSIRIHDTQGGALLLALETHDAGAMHTVAFSPSSGALVSTGFDTALLIHEIDSTPEKQKARQVSMAARACVEALRPALVLSEQIEAAIEQDASLDESVREEALRYCRAVGNPVTRYFSDAIVAASQRNLELSDYQLGLRKAENARQAFGDDWRVLPAVGLLKYRVGRIEEALGVFSAAELECERASAERPATLLAGLVLAKLASGNRAAAEADAAALRALVSPQRGAAHDERAAALLSEVEAALNGASP